MRFNMNIKQKYISFDIFDTLLFRDVKNHLDIFNIVETQLVEKYGEKFYGFSHNRIEAQKKAQSTHKIEATLDDIYCYMDYSEKDKCNAILMELETEKQHLKTNNFLKQCIHKMKQKNKTIIITSDMYLSQEFLSELLIEKGIEFDYIFVSSKMQLRKSSGNLYKYILKELNISKEDFVHIGDNFKTDYIIPKLLGLKSIHYKKTKNRYKDFECLQNRSFDNYFEELGYFCFGPLLYGFCNWLYNEKSINKLDSLCFISRDGQIVNKAYNILYPDNNYPYFLASRRALTVPLLDNAQSFNDITKIVPYIKRNESIRSLLYKLGIEDKYIIEKLEKKYGNEVSRNDLFSSKGTNIFNEIKDSMYLNSKQEKKCAAEFIKKNFIGNKIGLVDIGWYGTMQNALERICNSLELKYEFYGMYVGLLKRHDNLNATASGYIFDFRKNTKYDSDYIFGYNGLIELMFTANHGSAKKYVKDKSGNVTCELEPNKGEYSEFVSNMQKGALEFVETAKIYDLKISSKDSFFNMNKLLINPSYNECLLLSEEKFYDVYFEDIIQFYGWKRLFKNPKDEIKRFMKSNWKIGYLRKMHILSPKIVYKIINKIK